jgi:hypothetical protein
MENMRTRRFHLTRQRSLPNAGSRTLFFTTDGGSRRRLAKIFKPHEVRSLMARRHGSMQSGFRSGWKLVRRVDEHGQPFKETIT